MRRLDSTTAVEAAPTPHDFNRTGGLPTWLRVTLILFTSVALFDDLRSFNTLSQSTPHWAFLAVQLIFAYGSLALVAWRPAVAGTTLLIPMVLSLVTYNFPTVLVCAILVTVAVAATLSRPAVAVHTAVLLVWALAITSRAGNTDYLWILGLPLGIGLVAGLGVRHFVLQHRQATARLRNIEVTHQQLREQERLALARDLHDVVAHELTLVTMQAAGAHRQEDPSVLHRTISTMDEAARSGLRELRTLLEILRETPGAAHRDDSSSGLTTGSLEDVMSSLRGSLEAAGFEVEMHSGGSLHQLPTTVRGTAARIMQEATTNIIKYAPVGSACSMNVTLEGRSLLIRTRNALSHARRVAQVETPLASGYGLHGIQERVAFLNGDVNYGPREGHWILHVRIPFA